MSSLSCSGKSHDCLSHFHDEDPAFLKGIAQTNADNNVEAGAATASADKLATEEDKVAARAETHSSKKDVGFRRIIRNFTPSYVLIFRNWRIKNDRYRWFIITMSTGAVSITLHQIPYHAGWLNIVSDIYLVLNIALFLLFTAISTLRYIMFPHLLPVVLRHPHQSLFLAAFPVGLATIINMIILACVPAWGQGLAVFAWVLWWIDSVLATGTCFHLTWVMCVIAFAVKLVHLAG